VCALYTNAVACPHARSACLREGGRGSARAALYTPALMPPRRGAAAPADAAGAGPSIAPTQPFASAPPFTQGGGVSATQRDDAGSRRLRQAIRSIAARAVGESVWRSRRGGVGKKRAPRALRSTTPFSCALLLLRSPLPEDRDDMIDPTSNRLETELARLNDLQAQSEVVK